MYHQSSVGTELNMKFELNEKELASLNELRSALKTLHGKVGEETFLFQATGIGTVVKIRFDDYGIEKDITDVSCW